MSRGNALGFIESVGLASAIAAADAALKAANVELIGRENSKGFGYITIKIVGEVGAVQAAISAAKASSERVARVWSTDVIPRPSKDLGGVLVWNKETQGADDWFLSRDLDLDAPAQPVKEELALAPAPKQEIVAVSDKEKPKPVVQTPKKPAPKGPTGRRKKPK